MSGRMGKTRIVCSLLPLFIAGCGTPDTLPPPTVNIVQSVNYVTTSQKMLLLSDLNVLWESHNHTDLSPTDCYDMAISPDGERRFLAFVRENDKNGYELVVLRDMDGANEWDDYSAIEIAGPSVPFYEIDAHPEPCIRPRVEHLRDNLYGVIWVLEGSLYSAMFKSDWWPTLASTGTVEPGPGGSPPFAGLPTYEVSFVYADEEIHMVYPQPGKVMYRRGSLTEESLEFESSANFMLAEYGQMSDVIARDGTLYLATGGTDDDGDGVVRLWSKTTGGVDWSQETTCGPGSGIKSRFIYFDQNGELTVMRPTATSGAGWVRLQRFSDCGGVDYAFGIGMKPKLIKYSPSYAANL